jgi:hypothetical protein
MKEGREMFEAIEMHVERMLAKCSDQEKNQNPALAKHERRMQKLLDRLRKVVTSEKTKTENSEAVDANI